MNWGRGKSLDYVFVYSTGSYGDDGLDIGFGTVFENIEEVIKQLKISMREHISELIQYSDMENVIANLKANLAEGINHDILNNYEFAINNFDREMEEHQFGFFISDPFSKDFFASSINFTTEEQNNNEKNINLYNAISNYGGGNEMIDISFDSFVDIYMDYIEFTILEKLRIFYNDPKAINNIKGVLKEYNSKRDSRLRKRTNKAICGFSYYQEYHNYSWETTITINFFDL